MKTFLCVTFMLLLTGNLALAQSPGVPVVVTMKKGGATETTLVGRTGTGVRLQIKGSTAGDYLVAWSDIAELRFVFPPTIAQAQEALNQNQWERAATLMRPVAAPLLPYLDLPGNNGVALVMVLADTLRRANKTDEALSYYEKVRVLPKSPETIRAAVLSAQCLIALNRAEQAGKVLQNVDTPARDADVFAPYQLARAQVRLAQKDYPAALDAVSRAIAFSRMESETYPEALSTAAQCYEAMGTTNLFQTGLVQATLPATNRIENATQKLPGATNYIAAAQAIHREIVMDFPNTIWAQKSQSKIPPPQNKPGEAAKSE